MRAIHKLYFSSNNTARDAHWRLRQVRNIRLGCCIVLFIMHHSYMNYVSNVVGELEGYYMEDENITKYDVLELLHMCYSVHPHKA